MKKVSKATSVAPVTTTPVELANLPSVTREEVEAFVAAIDAFGELLGAGFVVPQQKEMARLPKPRRDAPTIVPMIADLSTRYKVASTSYPLAVALAKQDLASSLGPVTERIGAVGKLVGSIVTVAQSGAWEGAMVTYGLLKSEARGNAVLRSALGPVRDKLRPTFETEDGGKTKLKSKSKQATRAKGAAAASVVAAPSAAAAPIAEVEATAPAAVPGAPAEAAAAKD